MKREEIKFFDDIEYRFDKADWVVIAALFAVAVFFAAATWNFWRPHPHHKPPTEQISR